MKSPSPLPLSFSLGLSCYWVLCRSISDFSVLYIYMYWNSFFIYPFHTNKFIFSGNVSSDDDPCIVYKELQDSTRSQFNRLLGTQQPKCDKKLVLGWYRFTGGAGVKMPESCVTPGQCGTHAPGWYDGPIPVDVGGNSSGRVCFNWMNSCCEWSSPVTVKRCNGFYVYKLTPTNYCDLLYCGDGAAGKKNVRRGGGVWRLFSGEGIMIFTWEWRGISVL